MNGKEFKITNIAKMEAKHVYGHEPYEYYKYEATKDVGLSQCYAAVYEIPPNKTNIPYHYHLKNEEIFYIISGKGVVETASGDRAIAAGDILICPTGDGGAHEITNTSDAENLVYIDFDTMNFPEVAMYPHSGKLGVRVGSAEMEYYKRDTKVDYYKDE